MNIPAADPLQNLRDIHLTTDIGWWPPAIGWWILATATILLLCFGTAAILRYQQRKAPARVALQLLHSYYEEFASEGDSQLFIQRCHELLRRVALKNYGNEGVASLTGEEWTQFLDAKVTGDNSFADLGDSFQHAPYATQTASTDAEAIHGATQHWIKRHRINQ